MKKYNVNVNGTKYEITLEVVDENTINTSSKSDVATPVAASVAAPVAAPVAPAAAPVSTTGKRIECPMPGNILSVNVSNGDVIKKGHVLMILEAMKMENEIMAPCDGKISSVSVSKGVTVETGALLCVIE